MFDQSRRLPWFVALVAFVLYLCTMGHGVSADTLPLAAKVAGWDNTPLVGMPVVWLLTLPLHILPAGWLAVLLKLMSAGIAALILALITRTLQLLPWDHSWDTANRFAFLVPVLTAVGVCGLEFDFWQEATSTLSELVGLLLLATAVWLMLEYNVRQNPRWLDAAAVVWGVGLAENWAMLLTLPLFVAGLIWLQRLRFFQWRFILRMAGFGLAGLAIYAVLPMANGLNPHSPWTFAQSWQASLHQSKNILALLYYGFWRGHRLLAVAVLIYFLVPSLPLLVRMRDEGTQNKLAVDQFQIWLYRALRIGLLLACVWLAFDPTVGPQQLAQTQMGARLPMLTLDYVNALGVGFLVGNLLLISQVANERRRRDQMQWQKIVLPAAVVALALVLCGLIARNAPTIVRANFHPLEQFGKQAASCLPPGGGVILSDFPERLIVLQAALSHRADAKDWLAVDTHALPSVAYRAQLERLRPAGWLTDRNRHELNSLETVLLLSDVARTNRLFYLHPSYGDFFERFYLAPTGLVYEVKVRPQDPLAVPPLTATALEQNEKYWINMWNTQLAPLVPPAAHRLSAFEQKMRRLAIVPSPRYQDRELAEWYSMTLESWAVVLQQQGHLAEAKQRFTQSLQLNTNNLSAKISLVSNSNLQMGVSMGLAEVAKVAGQMGNPKRVTLLLNIGGPFDEPTMNCLLGSAFLDSGLLLQAAEQFERVRQLVAGSGSLAPELALAEIYNRLQMPGRSRPLIDHLRAESQKLPPNSSLDLNLALLESYSWLLQTNAANARSSLQAVIQEHPNDPEISGRVLAAYLALHDFTNALSLVDQQLAKAPDDVATLNTKAVILIQAGRNDEAIPLLNRILMFTNLPAARLNRAFARLARHEFNPAESDLRELEKSGDNLGVVNFGLATVAESRHQTNQAQQFLQLCLTNTPAGSTLWRQASARLQTLRSGN